jgi:hypothetical protein
VFGVERWAFSARFYISTTNTGLVAWKEVVHKMPGPPTGITSTEPDGEQTQTGQEREPKQEHPSRRPPLVGRIISGSLNSHPDQADYAQEIQRDRYVSQGGTGIFVGRRESTPEEARDQIDG